MRDVTHQSDKSRTSPTGRKRPARLIQNDALIEARLDMGWTPNDLGHAAGVSGNTVRAAEAGFYVDPRTQLALSQAVKKNRNELFPRDRQREFQRRSR